MRRRVAIAACQMDVEPAPTTQRLERAAGLIEHAASDGAELVVLPELFNTGYTYDPTIVLAAEPMDGPTVDFLVDRAQHHGIHVAGSLLVREHGEVFNALVLAGRDGRTWRYDKVYPWGWERSAFRGSRHRTVVAETELGRIGMLVGWDTAHTDLWASYAGRVQLVVAASCPIAASSMCFRFADGSSFGARDLPGAARLDGVERQLFSVMVPEQAAWLGVPVVDTGGCGRFATPLPRGDWVAALRATTAPRMWSRVLRRSAVELHGEPTAATRVDDGPQGRSSRLDVTAGETYTLAEVELVGARAPAGPQPKSRLSPAAYVLSDRVLPRLCEPVYAENLRRSPTAPRDPSGSARSWGQRVRAVLRNRQRV